MRHRCTLVLVCLGLVVRPAAAQFTIPNNDVVSNLNQSRIFSTDIAALVQGLAGEGVLSGCAVTAQGSPNLTVAVASGSVVLAGVIVSVSSGNVTVTAAHPTNPRLDIVVVNSSGTKAVVAGTAAANPAPPAIPASSVLLATLYIPRADTTIATNQITDKRVPVLAAVSATTRGVVPIGTGSTTTFLNANGAYSTPAGGAGTVTNTGTLTANKALIGNGTVDVTVSAATGIGHLASGTLTGSNVVESEITLANNTTNNVSTAAHGFAPIAPGDATKFLNGANPPAWTTPAGGGAGTVTNTGTLTANKAIIGNGTVDVTVSALTGIAHLASGTETASNVVESEITLADNTTNNVGTTAHGFAPKAPGDATKFLNGANPPAWTSPAASTSVVVQVKNTQTGAAATGTTVIPLDDTIPQNTEGDEYMTLSITPTSSTNKLKIEVVVFASSSLINWITAALFQDSTANALAAFSNYNGVATGAVSNVFTHYMTAGTTSATTFKVRAGRDASAAGTVTFNGQGGARRFGGVLASSLTITEIIP